VDLALSRARDRVLRGGRSITEPVIRRRFDRSARNFLVYRNLAGVWTLFDNSGEAPKVIALGKSGTLRRINEATYAAIVERYGAYE
jgi:predicted ABC-type ATPase